MRLFVGVWPPAAVLDALGELPRPDHPALRWTTREQQHVTLRFLGEVDDDEVAPLIGSVEEHLVSCPATEAVLGPEVTWLGRPRRSPLVVPVAGVDPLAAAVADATGGAHGAPDRPFRGHLTLARVRRDRTAPADLAGTAITGAWAVERVAVVRSQLHPDGARYDTLAEIAL